MIRKILCWLGFFHTPDEPLCYDDFRCYTSIGYIVTKTCKHCGRTYTEYYKEIPILWIIKK